MPILQHSGGKWLASAPQPDGNGAELRFLQCQWLSDDDRVALETDERTGAISVGSWREVLVAMESADVVDAEVKGHVLKRLLPAAGEPDEQGTGSWEIQPKSGVGLFYRWPAHNGNVGAFV